jgi:hypothetical protein
MSLSNLKQLDDLAKLALKSSGLLTHLNVIMDDIEEEIAGSYEASDDEEDAAMTPSYGGLVYTSYEVMNDDDFTYRLDRRLSDEQKYYLKKFANDKNFSISVCRNDNFVQELTLTLSVPFALNSEDSDSFEIDIELRAYIHNPSSYTIKAETYDDNVTVEDIDKTLLLYHLSLSHLN